MGDYLKIDKIEEALRRAEIKDSLRGVDKREVDSFMAGFYKVIAERHGKFGDKISYREMEEVFSIMRRDHSDLVNEEELQTIADILLDKEFEF